jgi:ectoine hydroxylase-related dioxygenase (phytanoyl-CoA dioxygenase family)
VKTLALYPTIIDTITEIYNKTPLPFQTLNFKVGTEQRIHSDTIHFNSEPKGNMCGVWVALEDITENNGPLFFYPGSHKEQELTYNDLAIDGLGPEQYLSYELKMQQYIDRKSYTKNYGLMPKGYAIIWAANLLHGGSQILDPNSTRHSQVTHYFFESKYYYTPVMSNHEYIQYRNPRWIK